VPAEAEPGWTITLSGHRFHPEASRNTVWFGDRSVPPASASSGTLTAIVPSFAQGGTLPLSVETPRGRSKALSFVVLPLLKAAALEPAGALPGDEVVMRGQGFDSGPVTVTVGGRSADVIAADAAGVRFRVPVIEGPPGSAHPVVVTQGGRSTAPLNLALGRLPLVLSFDPPRAVAGDLLHIRGLGFSPEPAGNVVSLDGVPALVLAATPSELTVVAPVPARAQAETAAPVIVQAGGRTSAAGVTFPLLRLVDGSYVLRFFGAAAGEGEASGQAFVASEIAPVLLLAGRDSARSVGERTLRVAAALNAAVDRSRVGSRTGPAVTFEAREQPDIGVGIAGQPDLILRVTPQDAAAYGAPPGLPPRSAPPTLSVLARYWAALLNDYVTIGTGSGRPSQIAALSPAAGATLGQLRAALPWQYGIGVANSRIVALSTDLRRRLRAAALSVP
jgi:hypothetical protein